MNSRLLIGAYFRQQAEMAMPDPVIDAALIPLLLKRPAAGSPPGNLSLRRSPAKATPAATRTAAHDLKKRLSSLRPIGQVAVSAPKMQPAAAGQPVVSDRKGLSLTGKKTALKELLVAGCMQCRLAPTRMKFVFGSGNAGAPVLVIGDAPGQEEDEQGLPFVGTAGQLLTDMLAAIDLDRNADVFITTVLKCRPPENRNPETGEIAACLPLLKRQIDIIRPKALLLLGKIAANALLDNSESIGNLRGKKLDFQGVPAMVIYHPAALLRNAAYKRPAWEDLQQFQQLLFTLGVHGSLHEK